MATTAVPSPPPGSRSNAPWRAFGPLRPGSGGFTLLELVVGLSIVAILAAVALPMYREQAQRSRLGEGVAALADARAAMERYYLNQRTYVGGPCGSTVTVGLFTLVCPSTPTATTYTIRATGSGTAAGVVYTIDHHGDARTTALPSGWGSVPSGGHRCWITRKGDTC
ncbi:MAG TPA: type IV pilin protein [Burkholderiaceae bacterium]|nr:type IV pilin protein [Burkholderiaceae bacterium]HMY98791.1 type IV pilin protein [Burkholderiaceae bacterium]HNB43385.1 type IV pilin protein [Burkholderiaceae bacterium]HNG78913.1 type IV pilin protein [Burkholderiaceae bacterium]